MMTVIIRYIVTEWAISRKLLDMNNIDEWLPCIVVLTTRSFPPLSIYFIWEGIVLKRFQIQYGFIPALFGMALRMFVHNQSASSLFLYNIVF